MNGKPSNASGVGTVKVLLMVPFAFISVLVLTFGFYEARKAYWDYQVDKLCELDGGIKINEVIHLYAPEYERLIDRRFSQGGIRLPRQGSPESSGVAAVYTDETTSIRKGSPAVGKTVLSIIRATDQKVIATRTDYGRSEGDLVSSQPSHHRCQQLPNTFSSQ